MTQNNRTWMRRLVRTIRARTICEQCGDPTKRIEWHHDDHPQHPERRIANLVDDGKPLEVVLAEIAICEALCRKCHMSIDGRSDGLRDNTHSRGEGNGRAKLTAAQVQEIRRVYGKDRQLTHEQIGRLYGVSRPTIARVLSANGWRTV